jgi:deoxyribodipyrimidine photolyase-related protein
VISPYLNLGLLHPREVCDAADAAWRAGRVPLASAEGFIRQVIGWREYVWGVYTLRATALRSANALEAHAPLPAAFTDPARTRMRCLADSLEGVAARGWAHHIQRLMVLGNLTLLLGTTPQRVVEWMWASFVDGAEWVMLPNAAGMALYADGGGVVTKPYAGGGAYIDRMSDYCAGCPYDPRRRTGPDACPFTVLYWDFLARHRTRLAKNPRMRIPIAGLARRDDLDEIRRIAAGLRRGLADGTV